MDLTFYAKPGPLTSLTQQQAEQVRELDLGPEGLCRAVQGLLVPPQDAYGSGLSDARLAERNTRPAGVLLHRAMEMDASPLSQPRAAAKRVVGTCRHFAVLATAFLRAVGIPARARCGFAAYFMPPKKLDHWIAEYWSDDGAPLDQDRPADPRPGRREPTR
jgi:hypothetical protein